MTAVSVAAMGTDICSTNKHAAVTSLSFDCHTSVTGSHCVPYLYPHMHSHEQNCTELISSFIFSWLQVYRVYKKISI